MSGGIVLILTVAHFAGSFFERCYLAFEETEVCIRVGGLGDLESLR